MKEELRPSDWRPAAALIPGLVHFASERPTFNPPRPVRRIRLFIPGFAKLRLIRLTVKPVAPHTLAGAQLRQSSFEDGAAGDPSTLLVGRHVHTRFESHPFWEATFPAPIPIAFLQLTNLLGRGGVESFGLNLEIEDDLGGVLRWANGGEREMGERLARFSGQVDRFLAAFSPDSAAAAAAGAALTFVIACAARAIETSVRPPASGGARLAAIGAVVALLKATAAGRRKRLLLAAPILDALTERGPRQTKSAFDTAEIEALAIVATAQVLAGSVHARSEAAENGEFLRSAPTVALLEERINAHFLQAGGDPAQTPLMFRKHGLSGPILLADVDGHLDALETVSRIAADRLGIECALCYGTLLGAVRERAFIAHDDDVDLAFPLAGRPEDCGPELRRICEALEAAGLPARSVNDIVLKVTVPASGIVVDLFPIFAGTEAQAIMAMEKMKLRAVPRSLLLPFAPIDFYGRRFLAPAQPERFLAERYGKSWRTPIREVAGGKGVVSD